MAAINRGDNTGAFGGDFLRIYLNNPNNLYIQKAVFQINGNLEKEFIDPIFPLKINFTGQETELLCQVNHCKLALWDESGRRRTADGKYTFFVKENNIKSPDTPDYSYDDVVQEEDNSIYFDLEDPEFAAEFVIEATPSKLSQLQIDVPIMTPDKIIAGRNIQTHVDGDYITISADLETKVEWDNIEGKPTINGIPLEGNVEIHFEGDIPNADWNATEGPAEILNKPKFAVVAYTGNYNDIVGTPNIPTKVSQLENDANYLSSVSLDDYYTKEEVDNKIDNGQYIEPVKEQLNKLEQTHQQDVFNLQAQINTKTDEQEFLNTIALKADIQYVDDCLYQKLDSRLLGKGVLSIYRNGTLLNDFSANEQVNVEVNIDVPEKISQLQNDLNFITKEELDPTDYVSQSEYDQDKRNFASIDSIGTGILTFRVNNNTIGTFNANSSTNKTFDIDVPTRLSELNNDIEMVTQEDLTQLEENIADLQTDIDNIPPQLDKLQIELDGKVNVEAGKTLISQAEIDRLSQLHDYDDTEVRNLITQNTENISTLSGYLNNKVDKQEGKSLSTNDFTNTDKDNLDKTVELAEVLDVSLSRLNTVVERNTNNIQQNTTNIQTLNTNLQDESTKRQDTDNYLQSQIEALTTKSSVVDIVATEHDLEVYDTSKLQVTDVICVLKDETQNDTTTYYRWDGNNFNFIGSEGEYYTKSDANGRFVPQTRLINGHNLTQDLTLTASDVNALSYDTVIGNGVVTIQRNGISLGTFTLNQVENKAIDIPVPDRTSELENDNNFITMDDMFTYIGDVPIDNNLQDQVDAIKEGEEENTSRIDMLQNLITGSLEGLPEVAVTGSYNDLKDKPTIPDKVSQLENDLGYITAEEVEAGYVKPDDLPTKVSQFENDRGYVTNNAIGRGILTLQINGTEVGTWMANEKDNYLWNIPVDNQLSTTSTLPVENNVITLEAQRIDASAVHITGNETVNGIKTFENVILQQGTAPTMATVDNSTNIATTAYVKNQDYCTNTDAVHKATAETITGDKTFTGITTLNVATGVTVEPIDNSTNLATTAFVHSQDYCTNSEAVHKFGNEVIQGDKTFNDTVTHIGIVNLSKYSHVPTPDEDDPANEYIDLVVNIEYVQKYISQVNTRIDNEVITLNSTITQVQSTLQNNINSLQTTVTNNQQQHQQDVSNINSQIQQINTEISSINSNFNNYYTKQEVYTKAEVDGLIQQKDTQISALQTLIEQLQSQLTSLEERVTALEPTEEPTEP